MLQSHYRKFPSMNNTPDEHAAVLDIRKYSNRRYYDTTRSCHLTLEQIRTLVRDGHTIKVTDSKTGNDITAQVLTQIILELETPKLSAVPVSFLAELIRMNEQMITQLNRSYVAQPFAAWLEYQKQLHESLRQMQGWPSYPPFSAWGAPTPFNRPKPKEPAAAAPGQPKDMEETIQHLREEIASLKREIRSGSRRKGGTP